MRHLKIATLLWVHWVLSGAAWAEGRAGTFPDETLKVGGDEREYRLVVPKTVDLKKPAPLVFAFHGFLVDSKDVMPIYSKLHEAAEKHRFIVVFPNALGRSWGLQPKKVVQDVAFFDALLKKISAGYQIDPDRIYATGMSNGGYFANLIGRERSHVVAAVACHSGMLGLQTAFGIRADRKFPVLIIHGARDRIIHVSIARDSRDQYLEEGHEVQFVEIARLGHFWGTQVEINETMWKFFAEHPRKKN